ncbi:MAG: DUF2971 domain-containing protein [Prevotella sp.]|nr:DUF2971 domain-containing protein [Prevotella sp.]
MNTFDLYDKIIEFNEAFVNQQMISEIAHYTSIEALRSIARSVVSCKGESFLFLRATNALYSNDREELQVGYEFMMDIFRKLEKGRPEKCQITNYMKEISKSVKYSQYSRNYYLNWFYSESRAPYIISFSRLIDKLLMWKQVYGRGGKGVCLVFDLSTLISNSDSIIVNSPQPIIYGERFGYVEFKNMFIRLIANEYQSFLIQVRNVEILDDIIDLKLQTIDTLCSFVSSYFKSEKWHDEQEVRVMCMVKDEKKYIKLDEKNRPYLSVMVPLRCLKKLIIGPTVSNTSIVEIQSYAQNLNLSPENIIVSKEPLK